jgi:hypothetical protein
VTRALAFVAVVAASSAARADTTLFPLTGPSAEALTARLASELGATLSTVALEDAAGLLECTIDKDDCLAEVARSVSADRIVFGVVSKTSTSLRVTLTKYDAGKKRVVRTFELTGGPDRHADELATAIGPMFDKKRAPAPVDPPPKPRPKPTPKPEPDPVVDTVDTAPLPDTENPVRVDSSSDRPPTPLYVWGLIGGGVAAIGGGVGFLMSARTLRDDVESAPTETPEDFDRLTALERSGRNRTLAGNILLITGGVAAATGVVLAIVHRTRGGSVRVEPAPAAGGGMVMITVER